MARSRSSQNSQKIIRKISKSDPCSDDFSSHEKKLISVSKHYLDENGQRWRSQKCFSQSPILSSWMSRPITSISTRKMSSSTCSRISMEQVSSSLTIEIFSSIFRTKCGSSDDEGSKLSIIQKSDSLKYSRGKIYINIRCIHASHLL